MTPSTVVDKLFPEEVLETVVAGITVIAVSVTKFPEASKPKNFVANVPATGVNVAATPFVVLVIALDAADNVLVVAPDRIEAVLLRAITPEVGFATRTESEATPLCSPDSAKVLAAVVVIDVAPVNVPPSLTSFPVKVKPLEAVVLSGPKPAEKGEPTIRTQLVPSL